MIDCRKCKWITTKKFYKPGYKMHCKARLLFYSDYFTSECGSYVEKVEEKQ